MSRNTDLLRVAHPMGTQHATNTEICATGSATANATAQLKALAVAGRERNSTATAPQQGGATSATSIPPENTNLLRSVAVVPEHQADPLRWPRFLALCEAQGVGAEEVQALFTERDIQDLCEHDDALLPKFAVDIVKSIKRHPQAALRR